MLSQFARNLYMSNFLEKIKFEEKWLAEMEVKRFLSSAASDMGINLEFFAKVKAIKLHCCLGSGFISHRNDIAST